MARVSKQVYAVYDAYEDGAGRHLMGIAPTSDALLDLVNVMRDDCGLSHYDEITLVPYPWPGSPTFLPADARGLNEDCTIEIEMVEYWE